MALQQLLNNLNSRDAGLREDAERCLRALSPDELIEFAQLEQTQFQRWAWRAWAKALISSSSSLILIMVVLAGLRGWFGKPPHIDVLLVPMLFCIPVLLFYRFWVQQRPYSRHSLMNVIRGLNDVRFVPILLTMQQELTRSIERKAVREALMHLLPQLRANQAGSWTSEQWNVLMSQLRHPLEHVEITVAVLKSLEQIGDERFVDRIKHLASMRTVYSLVTVPPRVTIRDANIRSVIVKQAAQECLPFLEQRQHEAKQAQTLLRASTVTPSPDTLLRPAIPTVEKEEGEQLLRSAPDI